MQIPSISEIEEAFIIESTDPIQRIADTIKAALKHFPSLKEGFFSDDKDVKKKSCDAIAFVLNKIDDEIDRAHTKTGFDYQRLLGAIYQSSHLTPIECQQFLQAQALIMQHKNDIFHAHKEEAPKKKKYIKTRFKI